MNDAPIDRLRRVLDRLTPAAIAVSGGVDSTALALVAHRQQPDSFAMIHAISAAVPAAAGGRLRALARREGWRLEVIDAGEFDDPDYRANPVNRCFYCKTNLYRTIAKRARMTILAGTNCDDLGDFRPGLDAARDHGVRHPYVEAGLDKAAVRAIAAALGFERLAALPAAPCLSSRVETGIAIEPELLRAIHGAERLVGRALKAATVRCRLRRGGAVIELDTQSLLRLDANRRAALAVLIARRFARAGQTLSVDFAPYRMGSAFLRVPPT